MITNNICYLTVSEDRTLPRSVMTGEFSNYSNKGNPTVIKHTSSTLRSQAQSILLRRAIWNEILGKIEKLEMSFFQLPFPSFTNACNPLELDETADLETEKTGLEEK